MSKSFKKSPVEKKILFAVPFNSHFYHPIKAELEKLGFEVTDFDYRKNSFLEKTVFALSFIKPEVKNFVTKMRNKRLVRVMKKKKIPVLLVSKGELINEDTIKELKTNDIKTINWFSDLLHYFPNDFHQTLAEYDYVFTPDQDDIDKYGKKINLIKLPYGAPALTKKPNFKKRKSSLTFIGAISKERVEMMDELKEFEPVLWGDHKWAKSNVAQFYKGEWLTPDQVLEVLQDTKIAFNVHRVDINEGTTPNIRVFEATSNGALLLTDFRKDLPKYFKIKGKNKEIIVYKDYQELKRLIKYYLTHDKERIAIAKKGFKRSLKDHSYGNRIKRLLKITKIV